MNNRLYVGNLSFNTDEQSLRGAFESVGQVSDVAIMSDRESGRSRGFGFVTMGDAQGAQAAISQLNGRALDGRPQRVDAAAERQPRGEGGGRSFGR